MVPTLWFPKLTLAGERLPIVPVPLNETVCGLPFALSAIETVPVTVPFTAGVKVTEIVQLAPAASGDAQLFVWANGGLALMPEIVRLAVPELVRVTACAGLVVPLVCVLKVRVVGDSVTAGVPA